MASCTTALAATSACVVIAPMTTARPLRSMPFISATAPRSTRFAGEASRCFMVGSSVCPPASSFASSLRASMPAA